MKKISVGFNVLHNHSFIERECNVPKDHVVVDVDDWLLVIGFINGNPSIQQSFEEYFHYHNKVDSKQKENIDEHK